MSQNITKIAIMSIVFAAIAEGSAFLGFQLLLKDRLATHWRVNTSHVIAEVSEDEIGHFQTQFFDHELGWTFGPGTNAISYATFDQKGARFEPLIVPGGVIAAYGDSFTFGEDVSNDQTWPHYLSVLRGTQVANYGVAGYGPDQAFLRLRRHLDSGRAVPETVILGMLSENVARLVNVWRHMYVGVGEKVSFKPRLINNEQGPRWLPNPLPSLTGLDAVRAAISSAAETDFWFDYNQSRPHPSFPYLWAALDTFHYLAFRVKRWPDLYEIEEPVAVLALLLEEFIALSRKYEFQPILLVIPMGQDLRARDQGLPSSYDFVIDVMRNRFSGELQIVDVLHAEFESERFNLRPFAGHASSYGNQIIAQTIDAALGRR